MDRLDHVQTDSQRMRANYSFHSRIAARAEVFHVDGISQLQAGQELFAALVQSTFQNRRLISRFGHTPCRVQQPGLFESLPASHGKEKFFGKFHKSISSQQ